MHIKSLYLYTGLLVCTFSRTCKRTKHVIYKTIVHYSNHSKNVLEALPFLDDLGKRRKAPNKIDAIANAMTIISISDKHLVKYYREKIICNSMTNKLKNGIGDSKHREFKKKKNTME